MLINSNNGWLWCQTRVVDAISHVEKRSCLQSALPFLEPGCNMKKAVKEEAVAVVIVVVFPPFFLLASLLLSSLLVLVHVVYMSYTKSNHAVASLMQH